MALLFSMATLLAGPFVYALGQRRLAVRQFLDGFVFITIAGIVCIHIVPDALAEGGTLTLAFLLLGLGFPLLLERVFDRALHQAHSFILLLAALGLVVHALMDGIALMPGSESGDGPLAQQGANHLALGVILHRLPVGMAIWWSLRPQFGRGIAIAVFGVIMVASAVSYLYAAPILAMTEARSLAYFQSFVAGSLVHIVAFGARHDHARPAQHPASGAEQSPRLDGWGYRLGILVGLFLVFALPHLHHDMAVH